MRRLVDLWWMVACVLLVGVLALTAVLVVEEADRHDQLHLADQHQAVLVLTESVHDVLAREVALAGVVGTLPGSINARWPVLSSIVMSQPLANAVGFIQPVTQRNRARFERRTGLRLVDPSKPGTRRVAGRRALHLVLTSYRQVSPGPPPLGIDLGGNPLRRGLLLQAARTGLQVASPPIEFLGRDQPTRGVAVYIAVRDPRGRLKGWISAAYEARQLAVMVTNQMRGVALTIRDGTSVLVQARHGIAGPPAVIAVAGRRWTVWADTSQPGISAVPWLVLSLGLVLALGVTLILRRAATSARQSTQQLALRDAEEAAIAQIATLVAQGAPPVAVFTSVAENIGKLFDSSTGAISRFDKTTRHGTILGGWTRDGQDLTGSVYALEGVTASAEVFRSGQAARIDAGYESTTDPVSDLMAGLGAKAGVACPIVVAGELWGALGAAYDQPRVPAGVEGRLERFASLVGLAISNADAWDRLARQALTDPLTGIANRRAFRERLTVEAARARRYGRDLSLVLMDLDHFKAVNDLHGHPAGDRVLVLFAQRLSAHSREGELVARIGGEEFAWLMPETDQRGAYAGAERLRAAIESVPLDEGYTVTVSAGVCSSATAQDADAFLRNADRALYWAKDGGRNMTSRYTDEPAATDSSAADAHLARPA